VAEKFTGHSCTFPPVISAQAGIQLSSENAFFAGWRRHLAKELDSRFARE
jgi:hypothetical protein